MLRMPQTTLCLCKLSHSEFDALTRVKDSKLYTCGSALFPPGSVVADTIVVKEALSCTSPIERQYYSSVLVKLPPMCYYCGIGDESQFVNDQEIKELCQCYAVVLPICFLCKSKGKKVYTKMPMNVAKRRKV